MALVWFFDHVVPLILSWLYGESIKLMGEWHALQDHAAALGMPVVVNGKRRDCGFVCIHSAWW
jgi:hypothetical protein